MQERHLASAVNILRNIRYITIATVRADGQPWNTPVSASFDETLRFYWGSSPENIHSGNVRADARVFVVIYDTTAPEGTGEALYFLGKAEELENETTTIRRYCFTPEEAWINDEAKNDDGTYKHDIRVTLDLVALKNALMA